MKKIILGALALMIGAIGFAQSNDSNIYQTANSSSASVDQDGLDNTADIDQLNGSGAPSTTNWPGNAEATIKQLGNWNYARQYQREHSNSFALSKQKGNGNTSYQEQKGNKSNATITQGTSLDLANNNTAKQWQKGSVNVASATQTGDANTSYQYQNVGDSRKALATVEQSGDHNMATQRQMGGDTDNRGSLLIKQSGHWNTATQKQDNTVAGNGTGIFGNNAVIEQMSDWNEAFQYQYGANSDASIMQKTGGSNYGYQLQDYGSMNAMAKLTQDGANNTSHQRQYGDSNTSTVNQTGDWHTSVVTQYGYMNEATTVQTN